MDETAQQPAPQSQVTTTSKPHDWKKVSLTILVILVVSGLLVAAYWFLVLNKSSEDSDLTGPVPKVTTKTATESAKESTSSAEKDETVDWETYKNETFNYQIRYPKEWNLYNKAADGSEKCTRPRQEMVVIDRAKLELCGVRLADGVLPGEFAIYVVGEYNDFPNVLEGEKSQQMTTVDGVTAVKYYRRDDSVGPWPNSTKVFFNYKGNGFQIEFKNKDAKGNHDIIYDQILSTLKFLD